MVQVRTSVLVSRLSVRPLPRIFAMVDDRTRECLVPIADKSITGSHLARELVSRHVRPVEQRTSGLVCGILRPTHDLALPRQWGLFPISEGNWRSREALPPRHWMSLLVGPLDDTVAERVLFS
jgi:hypothetical protein